MRGFAPLLAIVLPALCLANTLTTAPSNNGSGGIFLDLTAGPTAVSVTSFDSPFTGTSGTTVNVEVWTRPGSYVGFDASSDGWTLTQTIVATRAGTTTNSPMVLTTPILIPAGETVGICLQATATGGVRYTGTGASPPVTNGATVNCRSLAMSRAWLPRPSRAVDSRLVASRATSTTISSEVRRRSPER